MLFILCVIIKINKIKKMKIDRNIYKNIKIIKKNENGDDILENMDYTFFKENFLNKTNKNVSLKIYKKKLIKQRYYSFQIFYKKLKDELTNNFNYTNKNFFLLFFSKLNISKNEEIFKKYEKQFKENNITQFTRNYSFQEKQEAITLRQFTIKMYKELIIYCKKRDEEKNAKILDFNKKLKENKTQKRNKITNSEQEKDFEIFDDDLILNLIKYKRIKRRKKDNRIIYDKKTDTFYFALQVFFDLVNFGGFKERTVYLKAKVLFDSYKYSQKSIELKYTKSLERYQMFFAFKTFGELKEFENDIINTATKHWKK